MPWGRERSARDAVLVPAMKAAGGISSVARELKITRMAVSQWRRVPRARLAHFALLCGYAPKKLRPDLYREEKKPRPTAAYRHAGE